MFIDKGQLLSDLNQLYTSQITRTVSLYSHPGMGKTRLLQEFSQGKNILYFKTPALPFEEIFSLFKQLCIRRLGASCENAKKFTDLFKVLSKASVNKPMVLILDDFANWTAGNRRFPSMLQTLVQRADPKSRLLVLLCKPAALYEKERAKEASAFLLTPFSFFEMRKLYPNMTQEEQLLLYYITGGVPAYLKYFPADCSVQEKIRELFFRTDGIFYRLTETRTREYYSASPIMRAILASIGNSTRKLQEICDCTELTPSAAGSLLSSLASRNLVSRIVPVTENQGSRRALYLICDHVFRFWYTCVLPYLSEIEMGEGDKIFEEQIVPLLENYEKDTFPDICREFLELEEKMHTAPFSLQRIGRWWGQHPTKKRTEYISIAACSRDKILLGACFWTEEWLDVDTLYDLQKHASLFPDEEQWYYLFSKSDFVSGFETISGNHVHVFSLEKMCSLADAYLDSTV